MNHKPEKFFFLQFPFTLFFFYLYFKSQSKVDMISICLCLSIVQSLSIVVLLNTKPAKILCFHPWFAKVLTELVAQFCGEYSSLHEQMIWSLHLQYLNPTYI